MSYDLSFSEDFLCDGNPDQIQPCEQPSLIYQAILSMSRTKWNQIASEVFHVEPKYLDPTLVLDRICQTNTCSNLDSPVQVWIDEEGWYNLLVYDGSGQD